MNHIIESQEEIFAFLSDPATHDGNPVKRIDTHAAVVFLAGSRVFKVKRAVRFAFLDFSTLERRRTACEAELAVNRPFAPDIYRRVVPITRDGDRLVLDGSGAAIEWAVEMRRFDEQLTFDHLADEGKIHDGIADELGCVIAAAHARAAAVQAEPWIAALGTYIDEHVAAFRETPGLFSPAEIEALAAGSRAAYERNLSLLHERGRRGLVRRIHGDLHLGNIVLLHGRPVLFDAIEFSPIIAAGDVLYDLAFLLMDLVGRGLWRAANIVFNRYLAQAQRAEDLDALAALPFFLSMRAAIRANVTAARLEQAAPQTRSGIEAEARQYFNLAGDFIEPARPMLLAIGGLSGTGKSSLARALAPELAPAPGAVVLRSDVERKILFGRREDEPLAAEAYTSDVTARVYATLCDKARRALAAGHSAIIDAVFAKAAERSLVESSAAVLGARCQCVFLEADLDTRLTRLAGRVRDASDANAAVAHAQQSYDLGALHWPRVDASGRPEQLLARAKATLT